MFKNTIWIAAAICFFVGTGIANAEDATYIGAKKCKTCHKKELMGNQNAEWEKGKHAGAFETLKSEDAVKIGKEKGLAAAPHESPECLKCHVTAYGEPDTAFAKGPLNAADGVQCESCHGPGSLYKKKKTMADHDKSVAAGMWEPDKDEKICTTCHNDESPTFTDFNFEERKKEIAHPIPEDVKGRYIEAEKEAKAAAKGE